MIFLVYLFSTRDKIWLNSLICQGFAWAIDLSWTQICSSYLLVAGKVKPGSRFTSVSLVKFFAIDLPSRKENWLSKVGY